MNVSRRQALLTTLFGASAVGLRALATGLPISLLLHPKRALADPNTCASAPKAQYLIVSTSVWGDPLNANVPGTYGDPGIMHPSDPAMAPVNLTLSGKTYQAAKPWASLPQDVLDRTVFFHMATGTPVHPKEKQVLELMGATPKGEMLPSLLAKAVAPCLNTVQPRPIAVGSSNPNETIYYDSAPMPSIPPRALKGMLASAAGPLTNLQALRDQTMGSIYEIYKSSATPPQKAFIDSMVASQSEVRNLSQSLLDQLASIGDDSVDSQIKAAVTLIQMNVAPVISIHLPFGGDNHGDPGLAGETAQTVSSVASIASLMQQLRSAGLQDKVTFMTLNVFGRTLNANGLKGRDHNANHHVSVCIGKPLRGGVVGGCAPVLGDYGATGITSTSGAGGSGGDIQASDTLAAFGKTMLAAVGGDSTLITSPSAKIVTGALA